MSHDVTVKPKCYVLVCAVCGVLTDSQRSDAITCSTACRVRGLRNGAIASLRERAKIWEVPPGLLQRSAAVCILAPELVGPITAGTHKTDDIEVRAVVWAAFMARVDAAVRMTSEPHDVLTS